MQSVTGIAVASLAMLLLGGSASAQPYGYPPYGGPPSQAQPYGYPPYGGPPSQAQPYGYGPDGNPDYYNQAGEHILCGRNLAQIVNYIFDPATGMTITREQYQARYPWTNLSTWTYDCASNLWTDHTAQPNPGYYAPPPQYPQPQYYEGDGNRDGERDRDRERGRDRDGDDR